jgi:hypothetical protein
MLIPCRQAHTLPSTSIELKVQMSTQQVALSQGRTNLIRGITGPMIAVIAIPVAWVTSVLKPPVAEEASEHGALICITQLHRMLA